MHRFCPVVRLTQQPNTLDDAPTKDDDGEPAEPNPLLESSPFKDRIGTNYVPTDDDIVQIRALVQEKQTGVDRIAQEIKRLEEQLAKLAKEQAPALDYIEKHNAFLQPIRRLPNEILQEIFCHCLTIDSRSSMHKDDFPVVLTRICSAWRRLAFDTPRLWSTLHVAVPCAPYNLYSPTMNNNNHDESAETVNQVIRSRIVGIQEWLRRSGTVPLSLCIVQWGSPVTVADEESMKEVFSVLRPHASRWKDLDFVMPLPCLRPFIDVPPSELSQLRSVKLNINFPSETLPPGDQQDADDQQLSSLSQSGFFRSESLRELTFTFPHEDYLSYNINWSQLTHLVLDGGSHNLSDESHFHILSEAHQLEHLRLETGWVPETHEVSSEPRSPIITLPRLKKLAICERSPFPSLGPSIRCPVLEELEYHDAPSYLNEQDDLMNNPMAQPNHTAAAGRHTVPDASLASILSHSGALIKSLTINPHIYSLEQLIRYLRCCPLLQTLIMVEVYAHPPFGSGGVSDGILKAFVTPDEMYGGEVLCPRLRTLVCDRNATFTQEEMLEFLKIKQGVAPPPPAISSAAELLALYGPGSSSSASSPPLSLSSSSLLSPSSSSASSSQPSSSPFPPPSASSSSPPSSSSSSSLTTTTPTPPQPQPRTKLEGVSKIERLVMQFTSPEVEGIYDQAKKLVPGDRRVFFSYAIGKPFFSVRDGLFRATNSWHSYYEDSYQFD